MSVRFEPDTVSVTVVPTSPPIGNTPVKMGLGGAPLAMEPSKSNSNEVNPLGSMKRRFLLGRKIIAVPVSIERRLSRSVESISTRQQIGE